jgi:butyryl-CoA dehydrogenase
MDFTLTEEQLMLQTMARAFATNELEPIAAQLDEEERVPLDAIKKMAELGLFGTGVSEEYGGVGGGSLGSVIVQEEIARADAGTGTTLLCTNGLALYPVYLFGSDEQKLRFVTPMARGEKMSAFALTESAAGSDPAALETTATKNDGGYVLNGTKTFISNGGISDIIVVFATIDKSLKYRGVTTFVVEKGTPGFSVGKEEHKLGIRSSNTTELIFDECTVPEENRIGEEGKGFRIALTAIDGSRVVVAAQAVGIAQAAFETSVQYAKDRQQFGQPIANFQAIQWMLADMATSIDAARLLAYRAAYIKDQGGEYIPPAAMAKVFAAETAMSVTTKAIQIHGGYGYIKEYPLERHFRDAKITEIYEGTSEMQRMTIARHLIRG